MQRPVWLFSRDTEQFRAPPLTTGGLKAAFQTFGGTAGETDVELVHFLDAADLDRWLGHDWPERVRPRADEAVRAGRQPVFGFSCYTWNVGEFLEIARLVKTALRGALVVAGGPHVQRAEDYLFDEAIDVVVLGEGEETFAELLDRSGREELEGVAGLAFVRDGALVRTAPRARQTDLDHYPSPLDVVPLRDAGGRPLYERAACETSRGCPYRCSFCEWGTGALGTKMHQFSLERFRKDVEMLIEGGIHDLWLCDSNFGALREDEAKAEIVIEARRRTGRPNTFATSWSKNHNARVQRIVRRLHANGLLQHYHLALQTLTPRALDLSHRKNMRANDYEPIVKSLAEEDVPVAAELIWGLPGDTLAEFEKNLDHLFTVFPNVNIFAYTLLPGTEFYDRREELAIEAIPVAGYGKAKGEYVVGCLTFPRDEGEEGYLLVAAHVMLTRGHVIPRTIRHLALSRGVSAPALLRGLLRDLLEELADGGGEDDAVPRTTDGRLDRMGVYERRAGLYLRFLADRERTYRTLAAGLERRLGEAGAGELVSDALRVLELDRAFCPRGGPRAVVEETFGFDAPAALRSLERMELPSAGALRSAGASTLRIDHCGGVGEILRDPDGGQWMRGRIVETAEGVPGDA